MTKKEYLNQCGVETSKDLTADQILNYFINGYGGVINWHSAMMIKNGCHGMMPDRSKGISLMRKAFNQDLQVRCVYVEGEGVIDNSVIIPTPHFEMIIGKN